jgi:hypothetical protein
VEEVGRGNEHRSGTCACRHEHASRTPCFPEEAARAFRKHLIPQSATPASYTASPECQLVHKKDPPCSWQLAASSSSERESISPNSTYQENLRKPRKHDGFAWAALQRKRHGAWSGLISQHSEHAQNATTKAIDVCNTSAPQGGKKIESVCSPAKHVTTPAASSRPSSAAHFSATNRLVSSEI